LLVALAVAGTAPAQAATTVGSSLLQRANLYVRCASTCTETQVDRPGDAGLTIPHDGVITLWRLRAATNGRVRLRILRLGEDGTWSAAASSDWVTLSRHHRPGQDILYSFPAQLPVAGGDRLALDRDARAGGVFHSYGADASYTVADFAPALADDASGASPTSTAPGRELLLNAVVEPDANHNGLGDETQESSAPPPTGPTATPVETPPAQGGSPGAPVSAEPGVDRYPRPHARHPAARPKPHVPATDQRGHRPVAPRPAPHAAPAPAASRHQRHKPARHAPSTRVPAGKPHRRQPPRRSAPHAQRNPVGEHSQPPARSAPPAPAHHVGRRHRHVSPRPGPPPAKRPGFHRHRTGGAG